MGQAQAAVKMAWTQKWKRRSRNGRVLMRAKIQRAREVRLANLANSAVQVKAVV